MQVVQWATTLIGMCSIVGCSAAVTTPVPAERGQAHPTTSFAIASVATAEQRIEAYLERSSPDHYPTVEALRVKALDRGRRYSFTAVYRIVGFMGPYSPKRHWVRGTYQPSTNTVEVLERRSEWPWNRPITIDNPPER